MARRSDSLSFEPTPAIFEEKEEEDSHHSANYMTSTEHPREVHFSPVDSIARRAQSFATTVPLLEPISSASHLPRPNYLPKGATSSVDTEAYIQQSRNILQTQRLNFERERKVFEEERKLFEGERKLWRTERALLKAKILDLEAAVKKSRGEKRRYSNDNIRPSPQSFRSENGQSSSNSFSGSKVISTFNTSPPPVWEGPENMAPASRVFSEPSTLVSNPFTEDRAKHMNGHMPSISEDGSFPILEKEISPSSRPPERAKSVPIPIGKIDKSLDGITIKSTALAPSFVAKVVTPEAITPQRSLSPNSKSAGIWALRVKMDRLLSPSDEKLKLHAGYTPIAIGTVGSTGPSNSQSTEIPTPIQENPLAPVPTACCPPLHPIERSDSYFSTAIDDDLVVKRDTGGEEKENEDPELSGPLALSSNNDHGQSDAFLDTLDAKLIMEAKKYVKSPGASQSDKDDQSISTQDDEGPRLRMKDSTNFGSAFGSNRCGNI